ncbi:beta-1,3-galactosyltransferase 2-like [Erpetoichthys calabaricus]|uniref:beta-1,3-galactosyltransferase 2-like n=1 Tax=Erpetoichthys calabaricus TaxID=27687 RepID=UPI0010A0214A|nr:beta-1,3-galactosyltransferase 2-like [Erpetoichthys calabaricus]
MKQWRRVRGVAGTMPRWRHCSLGRVLLGVATLSLFLHFLWPFPKDPLPSHAWHLPGPVPTALYGEMSPSAYKYVINEPTKCQEVPPFLVLMIPVAPQDRAARDAIRKTWGYERLLPEVKIVRLFYLGLPPAEQGMSLQHEVGRESAEHGDIIQKDFWDTYANLAIKTMMIMDWLATYCPRASYAMKIDSDMFLNVELLVKKYLNPQASSPKKNYIAGVVIGDGMANRNRDSKWYMPPEAYPERAYPPYLSGSGYVFSMDLAPKISLASQSIRPVPLEDVYVGLCLRKLGVKPTRHYVWWSPFHNHGVRYERCRFVTLLTATGFPPDKLVRVWHDFQLAKFTC